MEGTSTRILRKPCKGKGKRHSKGTAQRKPFGPPADKRAFILTEVYISKPLQNSELGTKPLFPRHPITPDTATMEKDLTETRSADFPAARDPTVPAWERTSLARSCTGSAADPALSHWGLFCEITRALNLFMHKCMCFSSDIKNVLVNHKALLPSRFAQIGFFFLM